MGAMKQASLEGGRKEGKYGIKTEKYFRTGTHIDTDYILCSGSVEGLRVQFALALFQVLMSPEQTSKLHTAKHG